MAQVDLGLQLTDYRDHACAELFALGFASGYAGLDSGEQAEIDRIIDRAERTFWLHPPGINDGYVWSCLRDPGLMTLWGTVAEDEDVTVTGGSFDDPTTDITASEATFYETMVGATIVIDGVGSFVIASYTSSTVVSVTGDASTASADVFSITADGSYRLPSDFECPDSSKIGFTSDNWYPPIEMVEERLLLEAQAANESQTGYPQMASVRWRSSDGTAAQLQELIVYPIPDADYPVTFPYMVQPVGMSAANPYPRGGPELADALLSVVLAVCEETRDRRRGDRYREAVEKCHAAMRRDRTRHHNFLAGMMQPDAGGRAYALDVKRLVQPTS